MQARRGTPKPAPRPAPRATVLSFAGAALLVDEVALVVLPVLVLDPALVVVVVPLDVPLVIPLEVCVPDVVVCVDVVADVGVADDCEVVETTIGFCFASLCMANRFVENWQHPMTEPYACVLPQQYRGSERPRVSVQLGI